MVGIWGLEADQWRKETHVSPLQSTQEHVLTERNSRQDCPCSPPVFFSCLAFVFLLAEQVAELAGITYVYGEDASVVETSRTVSFLLSTAVSVGGSSLPFHPHS